jgi:ppGpp synthetase/RelA/SpoT-type nucleotidyltranferase
MVADTIPSLADRLDAVHTADPEFRWAWLTRSQPVRHLCFRSLAATELCRLSLRAASHVGSAAHAHAAHLLACQFRWLSETDFPEPPPADSWIGFARDPGKLNSLRRRAFCRLRDSFLTPGRPSGVFLYGGLKPAASIERKIHEYRTALGELDLWDLVRFRLVVPDIHAACELCAAVQGSFGNRVVRCRNYYTRPRNGSDYRAIHFELELDNQNNCDSVEVQILTLAREAVGLLDHNMRRESSISRRPSRYREWLRHLSYAANIRDAERAVLQASSDVLPAHLLARQTQPRSQSSLPGLMAR